MGGGGVQLAVGYSCNWADLFLAVRSGQIDRFGSCDRSTANLGVYSN